jgi:hypothetical protein
MGELGRAHGRGECASLQGTTNERSWHRETTRERTSTSTCGEDRRSTPGKRRRRGGRPRSNLRDAPAHRERVDAVGKVGGRTERPEYSPERGGRRRESATLALILGVLGRFLVTRGRGGRRGVEDAVGRVRGWPERRHPGEVVAVVVKLVCLSLNFD